MYFELNEDKTTTYQNLLDTLEDKIKGRYRALNTYI